MPKGCVYFAPWGSVYFASQGYFASWGKTNLYGFVWADQDWNGLIFLKNLWFRTGSDSTLRIRIGLGLKNFTVRSPLVDFYYPILFCFWKMISESCFGWNHSIHFPKLSESIYTFLCCVYFALLSKLTAGTILPLAEHDWLK